MPLGLTARLDVRSARPGQGAKVHLVIAIDAPISAATREARAASRTVLAVDVSGSMKGQPLDHVVRSVDRLLDALSPSDEIGVVAFSDGAGTVVDPIGVDDAGKRLVRARVARLAAQGNTNVEAGLDLAAALARAGEGRTRRGVVLLSDGVPNRGAHTAEALREVVRRHRSGVSFFALGYGLDHCEDVLSAVGEAGGGGYELVPDPSMCARAFARALGAQADVVASGIEVVVSPADGVSIAGFLGREEPRFSREGVTLALPDMVAGAKRLIVAELALSPPSEQRFVAAIARIALRARGEPEVLLALDVEIADRPPAPDPEAAADVLLVRADCVREEARALADGGRFAAAASMLRAVLTSIATCPGFAANDGSALAEAYELIVDEAVALERAPAIDEYAAFRKGAVATRLAASSPESARLRGPASSRLIEHAAGDYPPAWLVVGGVRRRLGEECVLGRTGAADIAVPSPSVSRRHAQVYANDGRFHVVDLGSTNPTLVNGVRIGSVPRALADGDVIRIGDVDLRYTEQQ